jgi:hypothetical protein
VLRTIQRFTIDQKSIQSSLLSARRSHVSSDGRFDESSRQKEIVYKPASEEEMKTPTVKSRRQRICQYFIDRGLKAMPKLPNRKYAAYETPRGFFYYVSRNGGVRFGKTMERSFRLRHFDSC